MGTIAARKARHILDHIESVLAIELLCASQAMDLRRPLTGSPAAEATLRCIRAVVPRLTEDRIIHPDMTAVKQLIVSGALRRSVEAVVGPLD